MSIYHFDKKDVHFCTYATKLFSIELNPSAGFLRGSAGAFTASGGKKSLFLCGAEKIRKSY